MTGPSTLDFAKPYNIMCGVWTGMANAYSPDGVYWDSEPSSVVIYWKDAKTLTYKQTMDEPLAEPATQKAGVQKTGVQPRLFKKIPGQGLKKEQHDALRTVASNIVRVSFDLSIRGKAASGSSDVFDVTGTESMPGVYLFQLKARNGSGTYFNSQYFLDASQRNIVGPFVDPEGKAVQVIAQAFARVSYDVPEKYRS